MNKKNIKYPHNTKICDTCFNEIGQIRTYEGVRYKCNKNSITYPEPCEEWEFSGYYKWWVCPLYYLCWFFAIPPINASLWISIYYLGWIVNYPLWLIISIAIILWIPLVIMLDYCDEIDFFKDKKYFEKVSRG